MKCPAYGPGVAQPPRLSAGHWQHSSAAAGVQDGSRELAVGETTRKTLPPAGSRAGCMAECDFKKSGLFANSADHSCVY
jgi:hypothetical protein